MSPYTYTQLPLSRANLDRSCRKSRVPSADRKWATNSTTPVASSGPPSWVCRMRSRRHVIPDGAIAWVGRVAECQLAATYSESSGTKAVYRDLISASAVDGVGVADQDATQVC